VKVCVVEGCGKPVKARGWCSSHYNFHLRLDNPEYHDLMLRNNLKSNKLKKVRGKIADREFRYMCDQRNPKHAHGFLSEISRHVGKGRDAGDIAVRMGIRVSVVQSAIKQLQEMANPQTA
jgi:hypothetical protein